MVKKFDIVYINRDLEKPFNKSPFLCDFGWEYNTFLSDQWSVARRPNCNYVHTTCYKSFCDCDLRIMLFVSLFSTCFDDLSNCLLPPIIG